MNVVKKGSMIVALLGLTAILFAGCGGGGGSSSPPAAPPAAATPTGTFKITNNTTASNNYGLDEIYVSLSSSSSWGSQLNTTSIASGSSWSQDFATDTYDFRAKSNGTVSYYYTYKMGFAITDSTTYSLQAIDSSFTGSLKLVNNSLSYSITALYVSTSSLGGGTNQLSTSIAPGATRYLVDVPTGTYYVRAVRNGVNYDNTAVSVASHSYTTITYN